MAPRNTMFLIRGQILCSLFVIVDMPFVHFIEDKPMHDYRYAILICYFINRRYSYWLFVSSCIGMTNLLTVDRFICIVFPLKYILLRRQHYYFGVVLSLVGAVINSIHFLNFTGVNHNNLNNATIYICGIPPMNISLIVLLIIYNITNLLGFGILNIITTVCLWRSIKNRSKLTENAPDIKKDKVSVRFSIANVLSIFIILIIYITYFIIFLLAFSRMMKSKYVPSNDILKYLWLFRTSVNPIMYVILFKDLRQFIICDSQ